MPRALLGIVLLWVSLASRGQAVLELADDFAFKREAVEAFAERDYRQQLADLERSGRLDRAPALLARLSPLMTKIADAAAREAPETAAIHWEIHACAECGESASARAGGKLLVGEAFIRDKALTDSELAYLIAHEAAHVIAQHTRELATVARYFMDNGLHREYWDIQHELDGSFVVQLRTAFVSQRQEEEADRIGFVLGAEAGFSPDAMISLLGKLDAGPGFGSHPERERRLAQARGMLAAARAIYARTAAAP